MASRIIYIFIFMCIFLYLISILFVHVYNVVNGCFAETEYSGKLSFHHKLTYITYHLTFYGYTNIRGGLRNKASISKFKKHNLVYFAITERLEFISYDMWYRIILWPAESSIYAHFHIYVYILIFNIYTICSCI